MSNDDELLDFHAKRKVLFGEKTSPEKLREVGRQFMEAERYDDALEFFQRAEAEDLTRRIAEAAMEAGNTPLYMRAKKVLAEKITEEEWTSLAAAAEEAGLYSAALLAHRQAGHEREVARLEELVPGFEQETEEQPSEQEQNSSEGGSEP